MSATNRRAAPPPPSPPRVTPRRATVDDATLPVQVPNSVAQMPPVMHVRVGETPLVGTDSGGHVPVAVRYCSVAGYEMLLADTVAAHITAVPVQHTRRGAAITR